MKKVSNSINAHLATINRLAARLANHDNLAPQIEVDLLLAALRNMYDALLALPNVENNEIESSLLLADTDKKPVFAPEPDEALLPATSQQPSVEEIEGIDNNSLFEETSPIPVSASTEDNNPTQEHNPDGKNSTSDEAIPAETPSPILKNEPPEMPIAQKEPVPTKEEVEHTEQAKPILEPVQTAEKAPEPAPTPDHVPTAEPEHAKEPEEASNTQPKQKNSQPSLFDYFKIANSEKPVQRTLGDTLGSIASQGQDLAMGANKVNDLRTIININDKFSFMNELFHNNMKGYNDFIMRLNAISRREEALEYVQGVAKQYGWDSNSIVVKNFYSIFDRKF